MSIFSAKHNIMLSYTLIYINTLYKKTHASFLLSLSLWETLMEGFLLKKRAKELFICGTGVII